jgi:hypothetical protein
VSIDGLGFFSTNPPLASYELALLTFIEYNHTNCWKKRAFILGIEEAKIVMAFPFIPLVATVLSVGVSAILSTVFSDRAVLHLLFDGVIDEKHKTKYFFSQITDRYKESIKGFNRAMSFNIGFAIIALYAYFALPATGTITVPFISLPVSRLIWISLVPLISYGLQTFIITSFIWFMTLRQGIVLLNKEISLDPDFGDATNLLLDGALGQIWIILRIRQYFKMKSRNL